MRCRNPWGDAHEWRGPWSDRSNEWNEIDSREKQKIDLKFQADGEFWQVII